MKAPMHHVTSGGTFGMMAGEAPRYHAEVEPTHEKLVQTLKQMGLKHEETHGRYETPERSVVIYNPRLDQMKTLGKLFGQESVVYSQGGKHELHYTNGPHEGKVRGTVPGKETHEWFEHAPEDYYTHLPGNGYFRINFDFDNDPVGGNEPTSSPVTTAPVAKALPKGAKLPLDHKSTKIGDQTENNANHAGFPGSPEHAVMADELGGAPPVEYPMADENDKKANWYSGHPLGDKEMGAKISEADKANARANQAQGYAFPSPNDGSYGTTQDELWSDVKNASNMPHPNFYEWHDGHTSHHNPRPWDKQTAIQTAQALGHIKKNVPGDPKFDKQYNVFYEADHGSYRMYGGLNRQGKMGVQVAYAPKKSIVPGRAGRFTSIGIFNDKKQAHEARLAHHDRMAAGLKKHDIAHPHMDGAKPPDVLTNQNAAAGVATYAKYAAPYGQVNPGQQSNLLHYDYHNKLKDVNELVKRHGFNVYYAGGKYGKPDLMNKNYNTSHLMIYDPGSHNETQAGQRDYTDAWRQIHELSHALVYPELNKVYGEGRRIGKLGTHRTMNEAMRAVHWEWLAAHKQRELSQKIGVHVPEETFNKELNTVMHDAVHRAITGQFTEPSAEGFQPHAHKVPLEHALDQIRQAGKSMGLNSMHETLKKKSEPKIHWLKKAKDRDTQVIEQNQPEKVTVKDHVSDFVNGIGGGGAVMGGSAVAIKKWANKKKAERLQQEGLPPHSKCGCLSCIQWRAKNVTPKTQLVKALPKGANLDPANPGDQTENHANAAAHQAMQNKGVVARDALLEQGKDWTTTVPIAPIAGQGVGNGAIKRMPNQRVVDAMYNNTTLNNREEGGEINPPIEPANFAADTWENNMTNLGNDQKYWSNINHAKPTSDVVGVPQPDRAAWARSPLRKKK